MPLELCDYPALAQKAVRKFWLTRAGAASKQTESGKSDAGTRGQVTAGKHMDGFADLFFKVALANGLKKAQIFQKGRELIIPGFFRPIKSWDLIIFNEGHLVAALEFKSQVGSFGKNANNRTEEVLGLAVDLWTAFREGAFGGKSTPPFVGYLFLLEESKETLTKSSPKAGTFELFPEFTNLSYADRYDLLCTKMVSEQLYSAAAVLLSKSRTRSYSEISPNSGLKNMVSAFAGHIAAEVARGS